MNIQQNLYKVQLNSNLLQFVTNFYNLFTTFCLIYAENGITMSLPTNETEIKMFIIEKQNPFGVTRYLSDSTGYWSSDINKAWQFEEKDLAKLIKKQFNSSRVRVMQLGDAK